MTTKIDNLKKRKSHIQARIQSEVAKEKEKTRKLETRMKIIIGGAYLALLRDPNIDKPKRLAEVLFQHIHRRMSARDQRLFTSKN